MQALLRVVDTDHVVLPVVILLVVDGQSVVVKAKDLLEILLLGISQDILVLTRTEHGNDEGDICAIHLAAGSDMAVGEPVVFRDPAHIHPFVLQRIDLDFAHFFFDLGSFSFHNYLLLLVTD